jgi:NADPH:quinone reductase-like Zn-dependent oxidoreductase
VRALTISSHGTLDRLELRTDLPDPEPGPDEVRVRVLASALNHLDLFVVEGLPGIKIQPPWILGSDATGIVDAVGPSDGNGSVVRGDYVVINPGVSDGTCEYCRSGDNPLCLRFGILGEHRPGSMAEYVVVPARNVLPIPRTIPPEEAAAFTLATLTAWRMVVTRAGVRAGEQVLINGIGGGVALAALSIAKSLGAHVWVTSGSDAKLARARDLGADETLNNRTTDVAKEIRSRTGKRGVDVVIDNVGAATWAASLGALGKRGRLVTCGATSGPMVETDVRRLFWNQWNIMGSTMGSDDEFSAVVSALREGRLKVPVDSTFPVDRSRKAFERLQSGEQFGKVVIRISHDNP